MLHRGGSRNVGSFHHVPTGSLPTSSKVVLAVAPPLRVVNPTHWGWPHWLAPVYRVAGQHRPSHRTLEEFG
ncbi:MAG TPA: hypothetical protein VMH49_06695 [Thermoplasmata archaeon]|nr:hypothetical protein [Thermoplasmata archaeon]